MSGVIAVSSSGVATRTTAVAVLSGRHDHYCPCGDCYVGRLIAAGERAAVAS